MKRLVTHIFLWLFLWAILPIQASALTNDSRIIASGGGSSTNAAFRNFGTIGQAAAAGTTANAQYFNFNGFLNNSLAFGSGTGTLRVVINPADVAATGAQWRVVGGSWQASGASLQLAARPYVVEFSDVAEWVAPASRMVFVQGAQSLSITGEYSDVGTLINVLLPANGGVLQRFTSQYGSGWGAAANLTDGNTSGSSWNWVWMSAYLPAVPQEFVYSVGGGSAVMLNEAVMYNFGQGDQRRYSKAFQIWISDNGTQFTKILDGTLLAQEGAQHFALSRVAAKYIKIVVTNGYDSSFWELAEAEVYGAVDRTAPVPGVASAPAAANTSPIPVTFSGAYDRGGSGLKNVALWFRKGATGAWTDSGLRQSGASGSFAFTGMTGNATYYFALQAEDNAGNRSAAVSGTGDCSTVYSLPQNLLLPANGGKLERFTSQCWPSSAWGAASNLTDGKKVGTDWLWMWISSYAPSVPQEFVYSFSGGQAATLAQLVIYNYGQGSQGRYSRGAEAWISNDSTTYTRVATFTLLAQEGAQTFALGGVNAKVLKLVITSGYAGDFWELGEVEAYGTIEAPPEDHVAPVPGVASAPATASASPVVVTYAGASDSGGSGLKRVWLWVRKGASGVWTNSGLSQAGASGAFPFIPSGNDTYVFDLQAEDGAGNFSAAGSGTGDCSTMVNITAVPVNLLLPANGGKLERYTSQCWPGSAWGAAANLTDGKTAGTDWQWFWISPYAPAAPQEFVYSFSGGLAATITRLVVHNYGQDSGRYSRNLQVWSSIDGQAYTSVTNVTLQARVGAQTFDLPVVIARYLKLVVTSGYAGDFWELAEWEAYGTLVQPVGAIRRYEPAATPAKTMNAAAANGVETWCSGASAGDYGAENVVDGDTNTVWRGDEGGGPWRLTLDFGKPLRFAAVDVQFQGESWTNSGIVGSPTAAEWFDLSTVTNGDVACRYLYIGLWNDPSRTNPPAVREIFWREKR